MASESLRTRAVLLLLIGALITQATSLGVLAASVPASVNAALSGLNLPIYVWSGSERTSPDAIVFAVHGGCLHGRAYDALGRALAGQQVTVVSMDMRGYGKWYYENFGTSKDKTFQYAQSLKDIKSVLSRLRQNYPQTPIYCLGESLGANMAMAVASQSPQLSDGVIAVSPFAAPKYFLSPRMVANLGQVAINPASKLNLSPYFRTRLGHDRALVEEHLRDPLGRDRQSVREIIKCISANYAGKRAALKMSRETPLLMVVGSKDKLCNSKATAKLFAKLPTADKQLITIRDQGHLLVETSRIEPYLVNTISSWIQEKNESRIAYGLADRGRSKVLHESRAAFTRL